MLLGDQAQLPLLDTAAAGRARADQRADAGQSARSARLATVRPGAGAGARAGRLRAGRYAASRRAGRRGGARAASRRHAAGGQRRARPSATWRAERANNSSGSTPICWASCSPTCAATTSSTSTDGSRATDMKGVILAGGTGSRLHPLTRITNKHLLPVYDKPMIFYPIETLVSAGIDEIMVVTGGNHAGEFLPLLGNGSEFGLQRLQFSYQAQAGGIAEALGLCESFVDGDKVVVMLGDNILGQSHRAVRPALRRASPAAAGCCSRRWKIRAICGIWACRSSARTTAWPSSARSPRRRPVRTPSSASTCTTPRCFRDRPRPEAVGPRRARDHRRQQRLRRSRAHGVRHHRWLLGRRRRVDRRVLLGHRPRATARRQSTRPAPGQPPAILAV